MPRRPLPPWAELVVIRVELFLLVPDDHGNRLTAPDLGQLCNAPVDDRGNLASALFDRLVELFWAGRLDDLLSRLAARHPQRAREARALLAEFRAARRDSRQASPTSPNRPA